MKVKKQFPGWMNKNTAIFAGFIVVGLILAVVFFFRMRKITTDFGHVTSTEPNIVVDEAGNIVDTEIDAVDNTDIQELASTDIKINLEPWDGTSRVNVLVMGLDYHDWREGEGPPRTDSMILLTLDPATNTAGMLSIPRDLWVEVPPFGHYKINQAYQLGEASNLPGGGPGLAVKTVELFLGVPIHYYVQIDFMAFIDFIDIIGGVKVDVSEKIQVDTISKDSPVWIKPGRQTMPGEYALGYVRARKTENGDFDRALRQQQVILGIRNQILRPEIFSMLIANGADIFNQLSYGINTNMTFEEMFRLGLKAKDIAIEDIQQGVIAPPDMVTLGKSPDGLDILKPITSNIRQLRDQIFFESAITSEQILEKDVQSLMIEENSTVAVYNGTATAGLAGDTQAYLESQGVNITSAGNTDNVAYTTIIDHTGNPYTVRYLVDTMKIQALKISFEYDPNSQVDIEIYLGNDWVIP
ncbi:MAG: LCP family protein [Anaerolineales bacterium]|nr:LCP family protein [Anaerolineales bacterium]